jgi:hypothetical protein
MSKRTKSLIVAFLVSTLFLLITIVPSSSIFNMLPYMLHESISPGGAGETNFIIGFDIAFGFLLFYIVYKGANRIFWRKQV